MTKTSRFMDNKDINWEERRFWAATIILAGLSANYTNQAVCTYEVTDAVGLADILISQLSGVPLNSVCTELYQRDGAEL